MKRKILSILLTLVLLLSFSMVTAAPAAAATPTTINHGNITLNNWNTGSFPEVWDLTQCDLTLSYTIDMSAIATAGWAVTEMGIRDIGAPNLDPNLQGGWMQSNYISATSNPNNQNNNDMHLLSKHGWLYQTYDATAPNTLVAPYWSNDNYGFWFDRDGVDQWQALLWGAVNGGTYNTNGIYEIVITYHAIDASTGTMFATINGVQQGMYTGGWKNAQPEFYPAGRSFTGNVARMQVFYGRGGGDGSVTVSNISVNGCPVIPVDVYLVDSGGNPVSGAVILNGPGVANFGTTDGAGHASKNFPAATTNLDVWTKYNNTTSAHITQDISVNPVFNFHTNKLTLRLETCSDGTPLNGGKPRWGAGATYTTRWFPTGSGTLTGSSAPGETAAEIFPGTYSFEMQYQSTAQAMISQVIPDTDFMITWKTTKVTFNYSGQISYGGGVGDGTWFNSTPTFQPTKELLPGTVRFHFRGGNVVDIDVSGCSMTKNVAVLILKDHTGSPLAGGKARGGYGAVYTTWWVPGLTDASGMLTDVRDADGTSTMSYEMKYNNTTKAMTQDVALNSFFNFQTIELTLRLETCTGTPLDGGNPRYGNGSTYTTWWIPGGATGSSAPGETVAEIFPGTYSFEMQYKATADAKISVAIPDANTMLTWQTTTVTLNYAGQISYGGALGDSTWFTKPSMELLPGTYKFHFRNAGYADLTFSGCSYKLTASLTANIHPVQYKFGAPAPGYSYASWPIFVSWLNVRMQNDGPDALNVMATISSTPSNVTIVDGDVAFGNISAGSSAWSGDTYKIQVNMASPVDPSLGMTWTITYDDAGGVHYIIFNVPQ